MWANSAGNAALETWFGPYLDLDGDRRVEFRDAGRDANHLHLPERDATVGFAVELRWEDSWRGATTTLELFVYDGDTGDIVGSSKDLQSGGPGDDPHEYVRLVAGPSPVPSVAVGKTGSFTLTVSGAGATGGVPVATAPAPLGDNLQWVARYDNTTNMWFVYDLSGTFSLSDLPPNMTGVPYSESIGDLTHIQSGDITWIKVSETQTATLGGETRTFHAGLTLFVWP